MALSKRKRRLVIAGGVAAAYVAGTLIARSQGYSFGRDTVVRCRRGHLFTTVWIPGVSVKEADLTDTEREFAAEHRDVPVP
jgi:hypothetical protein